MQKKFYIIITAILLTFMVILLNSELNKLKTQDQLVSPVQNYEDNSFDENTVDGNELNDSIETPNESIENFSLLENLVFDNNVIIDEVKEYENQYIAIGSKNHFPYMQVINHDNVSILTKASTSLNTISGRIIDVRVEQYYFETTILDSNNKTTQQKFIISNDDLIPFYKEQLNINYSKGVVIKPEYMVIHETANTRAGADADAHYKYWSTNPDAKASAHFVVDSTQIYQMLELNQMAWHVGDNKGYSNITNSNTIGIEITVNSDGVYDDARQHAIELTIKIMKELNMDISQLKMHNDASGKLDPITMLNDPSLWTDFVNRVKVGLEA